jgi:hypothetical protein
LKEKEGFSIIKEKYEFMARDDLSPSKPVVPGKERGGQRGGSSATMLARPDQHDQGGTYFLSGPEPGMTSGSLTHVLKSVSLFPPGHHAFIFPLAHLHVN